MLTPEEVAIAKRFKVSCQPEESEGDFKRRLYFLQNHAALAAKAKKWGAAIRFGMKSDDLRRAIYDRLLALLKEGGFAPEARVRISNNIVTIKKIVTEEGRKLTIKVHYWIEEPWDKKNNKGRANHRQADDFLEKAVLYNG